MLFVESFIKGFDRKMILKAVISADYTRLAYSPVLLDMVSR